MLEVKNVSLKYKEWWGKSSFALKDVSLLVREGEDLGIYGPSGSGKSSMLYLLSGLKEPSEGEVLYKGKNLKDMTEVERLEIRRKDFGFIFQEHFLVNHLTVEENILVPCIESNEEVKKHFADLVELLGIGGFEKRFPHELSVGQKQRVAVARALINKPRVIFADEATSSLDKDTTDGVIKLLKSYISNHQSTLVFVSHDLSIIEGMSRKIKIDKGTLIQEEANV